MGGGAGSLFDLLAKIRCSIMFHLYNGSHCMVFPCPGVFLGDYSLKSTVWRAGGGHRVEMYRRGVGQCGLEGFIPAKRCNDN